MVDIKNVHNAALPMNRRNFLNIALGTSAFVGASAFGSRFALSQDTLPIGWVRPLTGPLVSSWEGHFAAADIATAEINAAGGILGKQLVKVEVDDVGAPASQPLAMRELIGKGVNIVVGPVGSPQTLASLAISSPAKILQSGYITSPVGSDGDTYPYHYQFVFTVRSQAYAYAELLARKTPGAKVGVLAEDSPAGHDVAAAIKEIFPPNGLKVVVEQMSPLRTTDMTPYLRALRAGGAEVLCVFLGSGIDVTQLFVGLQRLSWKPLIAGHTGLFWAYTQGAVPEESKYPDVYAASYRALTYTENEEPDARVMEYVMKIGERNLPEAAHSVAATSPFYDFLHAIKAAAEAAGSLDTSKIKGKLDSGMEFNGLYGKVTFSGKDHLAYDQSSLAMAKVFADASPILEKSKGLIRPRG
jgi:branched-chain amino acid transport system substrate-binding protein